MSYEGKIIELSKSRYYEPKKVDLMFEMIRRDGLDYGLDHGSRMNMKYILPMVKYVITSRSEPTDIRAHAATLYGKSVFYSAPEDFECFLIAMDYNRRPEQRFYLPRARTLRPIVNKFQMLTDDGLDIYSLSLPPRVGKSTLSSYYCAFMGGRNPHKPILGVSYSGTVTHSFYDGTKQLIQDNDTHNFNEIFPESKLISTDASHLTMDLARPHRYKTLSFRSLDASLTGAVEAEQLLYLDDLISGHEEAKSPQRLAKAWEKVTIDVLQRRKTGCKLLIVGTRWSTSDPIGKFEEINEGNPRAIFERIPALNEKGESNFDFDYDVGFTTKHYIEQKATMNNEVEWSTVFMQDAMEKEGALFVKDELEFYDGSLPDGEPDCVYMANDIAYGGGDSYSAPIVYQYGEDYYVVDVVFNKGDKSITRPIVISRILKHKVNRAQYEGNNGGDLYMDAVASVLKGIPYKCIMTAKKAPSNISKKVRIETYAPDIKKFKFLTESLQNKEYKAFMKELYRYNILMKNTNDDAPDSLAQMAALVTNSIGGKATNHGKRKY